MRSFYSAMGVDAPFDPELKLVTSWLFRPLVLACIRLLLGVYTMATLIVVLWDDVKTGSGDAFLSYFTRLTYIGLCAYFWASGVQTLVFALRPETGSYPLQRWPRFLQLLHLWLFSTISTYPLLVTIVFWALLSSPTTLSPGFNAWSNISLHIFNTPFALFEVLLTRAGPTPWMHIPVLIIVLGCYCGVAYITYAEQGFYPYPFLDPAKQHAALAGYIVGVAIAATVLFAVTRTICVLRDRAVGRGGAAGWHRGSWGSEGAEAEKAVPVVEDVDGKDGEWEEVKRASV